MYDANHKIYMKKVYNTVVTVPIYSVYSAVMLVVSVGLAWLVRC